MNYQDLDDSILFRLVQDSDHQAFSAFYDRYVNLVFSIAFTVVGNQQIAEEVVQDVFLRIWRKSHTYREQQSKLNTWLSAVTRNRAIDELRKKNVQVESKQVSWAEVEDYQDLQNLAPEEWAQLRHDKHRVRAALSQLPEDQREVLALAYFRGLTQSQIAKYLDQPLGTVKTRVRLGMSKLRSFLFEQD